MRAKRPLSFFQKKAWRVHALRSKSEEPFQKKKKKMPRLALHAVAT
jgi:hypothetical protein